MVAPAAPAARPLATAVDLAIAAAKHVGPVVPLGRRKHPGDALGAGWKDRRPWSRLADQIRAWSHHPGYALYLPECSRADGARLVVVDIDAKPAWSERGRAKRAQCGWQHLERLVEQLGPLPATRVVQSGSGVGAHRWFWVPADLEIDRRGLARVLGPGRCDVEILVDQATLPGSRWAISAELREVLPDADGVYRWANDSIDEIADLPGRWVEAIRRRRRSQPPRRSIRPTSSDPAQDIDAAVAQWNDGHPDADDWRRPDRECPTCGHRECFGAHRDDPSRWMCWSSSHAADSDGCGRETADGRAWSGDALDIEAHARGQSRVDVLRADGYLADRTSPTRTTSAKRVPIIETELPTPQFAESIDEARAEALRAIRSAIQGDRPTVVHGPGGLGKTTNTFLAAAGPSDAMAMLQRDPKAIVIQAFINRDRATKAVCEAEEVGVPAALWLGKSAEESAGAWRCYDPDGAEKRRHELRSECQGCSLRRRCEATGYQAALRGAAHEAFGYRGRKHGAAVVARRYIITTDAALDGVLARVRERARGPVYVVLDDPGRTMGLTAEQYVAAGSIRGAADAMRAVAEQTGSVPARTVAALMRPLVDATETNQRRPDPMAFRSAIDDLDDECAAWLADHAWVEDGRRVLAEFIGDHGEDDPDVLGAWDDLPESVEPVPWPDPEEHRSADRALRIGQWLLTAAIDDLTRGRMSALIGERTGDDDAMIYGLREPRRAIFDLAEQGRVTWIRIEAMPDPIADVLGADQVELVGPDEHVDIVIPDLGGLTGGGDAGRRVAAAIVSAAQRHGLTDDSGVEIGRWAAVVQADAARRHECAPAVDADRVLTYGNGHASSNAARGVDRLMVQRSAPTRGEAVETATALAMAIGLELPSDIVATQVVDGATVPVTDPLASAIWLDGHGERVANAAYRMRAGLRDPDAPPGRILLVDRVPPATLRARNRGRIRVEPLAAALLWWGMAPDGIAEVEAVIRSVRRGSRAEADAEQARRIADAIGASATQEEAARTAGVTTRTIGRHMRRGSKQDTRSLRSIKSECPVLNPRDREGQLAQPKRSHIQEATGLSGSTVQRYLRHVWPAVVAGRDPAAAVEDARGEQLTAASRRSVDAITAECRRLCRDATASIEPIEWGRVAAEPQQSPQAPAPDPEAIPVAEATPGDPRRAQRRDLIDQCAEHVPRWLEVDRPPREVVAAMCAAGEDPGDPEARRLVRAFARMHHFCRQTA